MFVACSLVFTVNNKMSKKVSIVPKICPQLQQCVVLLKPLCLLYLAIIPNCTSDSKLLINDIPSMLIVLAYQMGI